MRFPRILASPLAGTAGVVAGLCLISIPMRRLTSAAPVVLAPPAMAAAPDTGTPTVLRLRLLAPAKRVTVKSMEGTILLDRADLPAGESGHDCTLRGLDGAVDLALQVDFGTTTAETAVFLTVMPDAYEERTGYAIGSGKLEETLRFSWHEH